MTWIVVAFVFGVLVGFGLALLIGAMVSGMRIIPKSEAAKVLDTLTESIVSENLSSEKELAK